MEANRDFAAPARLEETGRYPAEIVRGLTSRLGSARGARAAGAGDVTLTITSCKRHDLFLRTMGPFLRCCTDLDRIRRFVCIDDGSSEAERADIAARFPFMEFIWKTAEERGHASSMNRLLGEVDTPWWLHLEDDWHFLVEAPYVGRAMAAFEAFLATLAPGSRSNAHWPHYSFHPSLVRTEAIRGLGPFSEAPIAFEWEMAQHFVAAGWTTAFFDGVMCVHTGRHPWE